jgi:hypothetical protein
MPGFHVYHRKVTEAWAVQFTPGIDLRSDVRLQLDLTGDNPGWRLWVAKHDEWARIDDGDWIIAELDHPGFYPCRQDVFAATYHV